MKILGICGYSGGGKTTLLTKLIPVLKQAGILFGVIKHSHHNMDVDIEGKDSYKFRQSGTDQVIIACDHRWALMTETPNEPVNLADLIDKFENVDLVLVEGFKDESIPKIVCHREANNKPLFYDELTIAIATDTQLDTDIKQFDINDIEAVLELINKCLIID